MNSDMVMILVTLLPPFTLITATELFWAFLHCVFSSSQYRASFQVPVLPQFVPITYPTGLQWSPNGEEVNSQTQIKPFFRRSTHTFILFLFIGGSKRLAMVCVIWKFDVDLQNVGNIAVLSFFLYGNFRSASHRSSIVSFVSNIVTYCIICMKTLDQPVTGAGVNIQCGNYTGTC